MIICPLYRALCALFLPINTKEKSTSLHAARRYKMLKHGSLSLTCIFGDTFLIKLTVHVNRSQILKQFPGASLRREIPLTRVTKMVTECGPRSFQRKLPFMCAKFLLDPSQPTKRLKPKTHFAVSLVLFRGVFITFRRTAERYKSQPHQYTARHWREKRAPLWDAKCYR